MRNFFHRGSVVFLGFRKGWRRCLQGGEWVMEKNGFFVYLEVSKLDCV